MRVTILLLLGLTMIVWSCDEVKKGQMESDNPFFSDYGTPFEAPPFDKIKLEHYMPAYQKAVEQAREEAMAIANDQTVPTFENTIVALENSGRLLSKVSGVFYNLTSAHTNDSLTAISKQVSPMLAQLEDDIYLNDNLFGKIETLWQQKDELTLNKEQQRLLEIYYKNFVRGGANLDEEGKAKLRKINEELSVLTIEFGEHVRKDNNAFKLIIEDEQDLAGLPENVVAAAAQAAGENDLEGKWVFTLDKPSMIPFLQYADNRDLRKEIYLAYTNRGNNNNEQDNKELLKKIANLRVEKANLLGFDTHSDYVLEKTMANQKDNVYDLLDQLWQPALEMAKNEAAMMQKMMKEEGTASKLESWDWWYYAEKIRKEKYDLNEEEISQYFPLEKVREGAFMVANKLYGLTFHPRQDIPVYHPDVEVFEVKDKDGSHVGIFYNDYFPRESKRGGAWMNEYRGQHKLDGEVTPIITNVANFTKPTGELPALLTFDEVQTLFHEFGHALHGLLSDCTYPTLAGTNVSRDFVEFPSQIMENWATDPQVMKMYARHYETGETIPDALIGKIINAGKFNQGFATVEYLAASYLDMKWHTLDQKFEGDVTEFENEALAEIGLMPEIISRYRSTYFNHIFSGGYSSGYYSYIWSAVLDSDGFNYFKETDLFDQEKAAKLRKYVYAAGNSDDPMMLYKNFRGSEPNIDALLEKRGLKQDDLSQIKM
ncbi:MAG: M3 family metallopeptidase [Candidatus Cyclobacteriaceae bacterium M3_2C_046]